MKAILALENGQWFEGTSAGAPGETTGEVVFNTGLTGYQEVLTDPSYTGQIVTMTAPQIGNYGVAADDGESRGVQVAGFVIREGSAVASNWRAEETLRDYLVRHGIVAIAGIDTRALTRVLRSAGVMRGAIATGAGVEARHLVERARAIPPMEGQDLVSGVTCAEAFDWVPGPADASPGEGALIPAPLRRARRRLRVAAYDLGMKWNILRRFTAYGCDVRVFPARTPAAEVLAAGADGVFFSNGPGDPAVLGAVVANARAVVAARVPVFGICLGHQILGQALGGRTFKLKFGHRGTNHPVKHLETGQVEITSQNHGFAVDPASLPPEVEVTHVNLYDGTVEGLRHRDAPVFCVQYHPEAAPGPHDADYLFRRFVEAMEAGS
jgi:carbamoyl-phosphate synthase small subunit